MPCTHYSLLLASHDEVLFQEYEEAAGAATVAEEPATAAADVRAAWADTDRCAFGALVCTY